MKSLSSVMSNNTPRQRYYESNVVGHSVVCAITGAKYPWKVGKRDENRLFKVVDTANKVHFSSKDYGCRVSHNLYYETPYQYMEHRNVELSEDFIRSWYDKQNELYPGEYIYTKRKMDYDNSSEL